MDEPAVRERFTVLNGERVDDGDYRLHGLPEGRNFRDPDEYVTLEASMLKVTDVAFAAPYFEFSEYQTHVVVEQSAEGGLANITFEPM